MRAVREPPLLYSFHLGLFRSFCGTAYGYGREDDDEGYQGGVEELSGELAA